MSGFGIYLHWPYCAAICPYCDFNVYRARGGDNATLLAALEADLAAHAQRFGRRRADSLFFGGGTPSLLSGAELNQLIRAARTHFDLACDAEITLEANPEDRARFAEQAGAGVTRFSVGAQALEDASLKALGRWHDAASAREAIEAAAKTGARVSFDLIYAREGQDVAAWRSELREALKLPAEHVSLYQLTIEPSTAFARRVTRGSLHPPGVEQAAALYEVTQEICADAGFPAYEISNHAKSAPAQSRHNLIYWRGQDWIGIGPGAHGRVTQDGKRIATEAQRRPADYVDAVNEHGLGWLTDSELNAQEIADEALIMGLRIDEGVDLERQQQWRGQPLNQQAVQWLQDQGLIEVDDKRLRLTLRGRLLTNQIAAELAA